VRPLPRRNSHRTRNEDDSDGEADLDGWLAFVTAFSHGLGHEPTFAVTFDSSLKQTLLERFSTISEAA
jgi:hypothetical protein